MTQSGEEENTAPSLEMSSVYNAEQFDDEFEDLHSLFTKVNSCSVCHATGRIAVNLPEGLAIVDNGVIRKYYEKDSPFRGKTGVRLSSLLPYSQLIAVVPESAASVVPDSSEEMLVTGRTVQVNPCSVYVYDLSSRRHIYQKDFNHPIEHLRICSNYIAVGNAKRVVLLDYRKNLESNSQGDSNKLEALVRGYKQGSYDESARYVELEGAPGGQIKSSLHEPVRFAFVREEGKTLSVFDTDLNIFIDIPIDRQDRHFCLSPDGKFLAVVSAGGVDGKIIEVDTRTLFTEFKRGVTEKQVACLGFCELWFGLVSQAGSGATFHFFPLRRKKDPQEVISSQYRRYFNTFREPVDFFVREHRVFVFSNVGCTFMVLDLDRAKTKHGEQASRNIESHEVVMWRSE